MNRRVLARAPRWLWLAAAAGVTIFALAPRSWLGADLVAAARGIGHRRTRRMEFGANVARKRPGRTAIPTLTHGRGLHVERSVTIAQSPPAVYRFFRDLENLPRAVPQLVAVSTTAVEGDIEIVADRPGELIAWRSVPGADVEQGGSVSFKTAPGDRGTEVRVVLNAAPPAGTLRGRIAASFGGDLDGHVREALRRGKQIIEAGEAPIAEAPPSGRRAA